MAKQITMTPEEYKQWVYDAVQKAKELTDFRKAAGLSYDTVMEQYDQARILLNQLTTKGKQFLLGYDSALSDMAKEAYNSVVREINKIASIKGTPKFKSLTPTIDEEISAMKKRFEQSNKYLTAGAGDLASQNKAIAAYILNAVNNPDKEIDHPRQTLLQLPDAPDYKTGNPRAKRDLKRKYDDTMKKVDRILDQYRDADIDREEAFIKFANLLEGKATPNPKGKYIQSSRNRMEKVSDDTRYARRKKKGVYEYYESDDPKKAKFVKNDSGEYITPSATYQRFDFEPGRYPLGYVSWRVKKRNGDTYIRNQSIADYVNTWISDDEVRMNAYATEATAKAAGATIIRWESGPRELCDDCSQYYGKLYTLGSKAIVFKGRQIQPLPTRPPVHPNCDCYFSLYKDQPEQGKVEYADT